MLFRSFYALYSNSLKSHRNTNVRIAVNILGEQMIETIASSIRLMGLNDEFLDYDPGAGVQGTIIISADGGSGTDAVNFQYMSPYGGPITKLSAVSGNAGECTYTVLNGSSLHADLDAVTLFSSNGIFQSTVTSVTDNVIDTSATTPAFAGPCSDIFPVQTLLTGPNNNFVLTYINGGANTLLNLVRNAATPETYVDFNSLNNPDYQIPFLVLEFMMEFNDGTIVRREWFPLINNPEELKLVKAVRIGFVIVSQQDRVRKKDASSDPGIANNYCPFDDRCYSLTDLNKTAYVFRRIIHMRNYDYLGRQ